MFAGAKQALDELAAVRPGTIEEAALRGRIAYEEGGTAAVETAVARVRAIDPRSALGYRLAGEQAARDYRFDEAAAFARKATELDADDPWRISISVCTCMRTGDETGARTALERVVGSRQELGVTKNLLDLLDQHRHVRDRARPATSSSSSRRTKRAVLRTYAVPLADEAYKTFTARYGFTPQGPILIEVFPGARRLRGAHPRPARAGRRARRLLRPRRHRWIRRGARPPGDFSWQATLWHELAHVFTLQLSDYRVPRWLTEGISVYEEHRRQPAWGRELTLEFAHQLSAGQDVRREEAARARSSGPRAWRSRTSKRRSSSSTWSRSTAMPGLRTLLLAYADGAKDADAFAKAFGRSVDDVEASFKAFIDQRYGALSRAMADPPSQVAARRSRRPAGARGRGARQLRQPDARSGRRSSSGRRRGRARPRSSGRRSWRPQATGDASPRALLAQIAEKEGDRVRARRELRQLLAYDHDEHRRRAAAGDASPPTPQAIEDDDFALRAHRRPRSVRRRRARAARPAPDRQRTTRPARRSSSRRRWRSGRRIWPRPTLISARRCSSSGAGRSRSAGAAGAQAGADLRARPGPAACGDRTGVDRDAHLRSPSVVVLACDPRGRSGPARGRRAAAMRRDRPGRVGRGAVRDAPSRLGRLARRPCCAIGSSSTRST